eukprot:1140796-Pelagomonas_calceolata.AAC.2
MLEEVFPCAPVIQLKVPPPRPPRSVPAMALCAYGFLTPNLTGGLCFGAGLGITLFGIMYMFVHDGLRASDHSPGLKSHNHGPQLHLETIRTSAVTCKAPARCGLYLLIECLHYIPASKYVTYDEIRRCPPES